MDKASFDVLKRYYLGEIARPGSQKNFEIDYGNTFDNHIYIQKKEIEEWKQKNPKLAKELEEETNKFLDELESDRVDKMTDKILKPKLRW
jgi:hypothetical protein